MLQVGFIIAAGFVVAAGGFDVRVGLEVIARAASWRKG